MKAVVKINILNIYDVEIEVVYEVNKSKYNRGGDDIPGFEIERLTCIDDRLSQRRQSFTDYILMDGGWDKLIEEKL